MDVYWVEVGEHVKFIFYEEGKLCTDNEDSVHIFDEPRSRVGFVLVLSLVHNLLQIE